MAAFLAGFEKAGCLKTALDLAERVRGLSRPNLDLDHPDLRRTRCLRRFEVQFNRLLEVGKSLILGAALGWRRQVRGTARHTTSPRAKR